MTREAVGWGGLSASNTETKDPITARIDILVAYRETMGGTRWAARRSPKRRLGGDKGIRTPDLLIANETLYQLSYIPKQTEWCAFGFGSLTPTPSTTHTLLREFLAASGKSGGSRSRVLPPPGMRRCRVRGSEQGRRPEERVYFDIAIEYAGLVCPIFAPDWG